MKIRLIIQKIFQPILFSIGKKRKSAGDGNYFRENLTRCWTYDLYEYETPEKYAGGSRKGVKPNRTGQGRIGPAGSAGLAAFFFEAPRSLIE